MGNVMKSLDDNSVAKDTLIMYADPASFAQGPLRQKGFMIPDRQQSWPQGDGRQRQLGVQVQPDRLARALGRALAEDAGGGRLQLQVFTLGGRPPRSRTRPKCCASAQSWARFCAS